MCRCRVEQRSQRGAALDERYGAQVVAGVIGQVEDEVLDRIGAGRVEGVLQEIEIGRAVGAGDHDLAVEPARADAEVAHRIDEALQARRPVVAVAGEEAHVGAVDAGEQAIAVELDLVDPARAGGDLRHQRGQLGHERGRQRGRFCAGGRGDRRGTRLHRRTCGFLRRLNRLRRLCRLRRWIGNRAARQHAALFGFDDVVFRRRSRRVVALLDQQPGLLPLAGAAVHAHQRPAAAELLAVQPELQLAGAIAGARIADRFPGAVVPHDHRAAAVLAFRDLAFEAAVVERMVLHVHGHALVGRVEARPLGNGPALQRAIELEPEVVVQVAGGVLLDDEGEAARLCGCAPARLAGAGEVTLLQIGLERIGHGATGHDAWVHRPAEPRRGNRRAAAEVIRSRDKNLETP